MNPRFVVMCRVEGGVTGLRVDVAKSAGQVLYFGSMSEARAEAMRRQVKMDREHVGSAIFTYWPVSEAESELQGDLT
jgi:hypothetical protein